MTQLPNPLPELAQLLGELADEQLGAAGLARLLELLRDDPAARTYYLDYMDLHARLQWKQTSEEGSGFRVEEIAKSQIPNQQISNPQSLIPNPPSLIPPIIIDTSPTGHYPLFTINSPLGGWLFSYAAATVITGVMLLVFWTWKVSHDYELAKSPPASTPPAVETEKPMELVGRITGTADCQWADPQDAPSATVPLGRKYALASGLMEITYTTGAKVILQGPCTYEVESPCGGFLSLGKLTARVESAKPPAANPKSQIPNPKFVVKTPTAIVTDLGTEFGVEVSGEGTTTSHVFRGSVRVALATGGNPPSPSGRGAGSEGGGEGSGREVVLRKNESARVENGESTDGPRLVLHGVAANPSAFVRQIAGPPKVLDLLDVVAGGDGTGQRRERGIDQTTGKEDTLFVTCSDPNERDSHRRFWPVPWHKHKLIDGVFVPDTALGAVQLDSAGHVFDRFPANSGKTFSPIWARAAWIKPQAEEKNQGVWMYAMGLGGKFMPEKRGLLGMCANTGITFDLEAVRQAHPGVVPARFHAVAGMACDLDVFLPTSGLADVWVFVDGGLKLKRIGLCLQDDPVPMNVELGPRDRFLTLVSTDGGNGPNLDWVVFGDPVLRMTSAASEKSVEDK